MADGQKLYGDVTLDSLRSKSSLATDADGVIIEGCGGGSQTPWSSDIDACGFNLLNAGAVNSNGSFSCEFAVLPQTFHVCGGTDVDGDYYTCGFLVCQPVYVRFDGCYWIWFRNGRFAISDCLGCDTNIWLSDTQDYSPLHMYCPVFGCASGCPTALGSFAFYADANGVACACCYYGDGSHLTNISTSTPVCLVDSSCHLSVDGDLRQLDAYGYLYEHYSGVGNGQQIAVTNDGILHIVAYDPCVYNYNPDGSPAPLWCDYSVCGRPLGLFSIIVDNNNAVYASDVAGGVLKIDPANGGVCASICLDDCFRGYYLASNPINNDIWTSSAIGTCRITRFDCNLNYICDYDSGVQYATWNVFDSCGNLWVADGGCCRIVKFDGCGNCLTSASTGAQPVTFSVDPCNNVWVISSDHCVRKFCCDGTLANSFYLDSNYACWAVKGSDGNMWVAVDEGYSGCCRLRVDEYDYNTNCVLKSLYFPIVSNGFASVEFCGKIYYAGNCCNWARFSDTPVTIPLVDYSGSNPCNAPYHFDATNRLVGDGSGLTNITELEPHFCTWCNQGSPILCSLTDCYCCSSVDILCRSLNDCYGNPIISWTGSCAFCICGEWTNIYGNSWSLCHDGTFTGVAACSCYSCCTAVLYGCLGCDLIGCGNNISCVNEVCAYCFCSCYGVYTCGCVCSSQGMESCAFCAPGSCFSTYTCVCCDLYVGGCACFPNYIVYIGNGITVNGGLCACQIACFYCDTHMCCLDVGCFFTTPCFVCGLSMYGTWLSGVEGICANECYLYLCGGLCVCNSCGIVTAGSIDMCCNSILHTCGIQFAGSTNVCADIDFNNGWISFECNCLCNICTICANGCLILGGDLCANSQLYVCGCSFIYSGCLDVCGNNICHVGGLFMENTCNIDLNSGCICCVSGISACGPSMNFSGNLDMCSNCICNVSSILNVGGIQMCCDGNIDLNAGCICNMSGIAACGSTFNIASCVDMNGCSITNINNVCASCVCGTCLSGGIGSSCLTSPLTGCGNCIDCITLTNSGLGSNLDVCQNCLCNVTQIVGCCWASNISMCCGTISWNCRSIDFQNDMLVSCYDQVVACWGCGCLTNYQGIPYAIGDFSSNRLIDCNCVAALDWNQRCLLDYNGSPVACWVPGCIDMGSNSIYGVNNISSWIPGYPVHFPTTIQTNAIIMEDTANVGCCYCIQVVSGLLILQGL